MIRRIIQIDREKCNGCGLCADACHEGAIGMADGKATLLRDDYCDGLGDCLPACPTGAITFIEREAAEYDRQAVLDAASARNIQTTGAPHAAGPRVTEPSAAASQAGKPTSQLTQWPVQIKLAPVNAPCFNGAHILVAADCSAYACGDFHNRFMRGRVVLIGCPKLDEGDYSEKLTEIFRNNDIQSLTVVRMEVPCCGGIERAAVTALKNSGRFIPWQIVTLSLDGRILEP